MPPLKETSFRTICWELNPFNRRLSFNKSHLQTPGSGSQRRSNPLNHVKSPSSKPLNSLLLQVLFDEVCLCDLAGSSSKSHAPAWGEGWNTMLGVAMVKRIWAWKFPWNWLPNRPTGIWKFPWNWLSCRMFKILHTFDTILNSWSLQAFSSGSTLLTTRQVFARRFLQNDLPDDSYHLPDGFDAKTRACLGSSKWMQID